MADVMVDGLEQTQLGYEFGAVVAVRISDYYFPVVRSFGGLFIGNPVHGIAAGSAHILRLNGGNVMSGHVTTHDWHSGYSTGWYSFAHYAKAITSAATGDSVFISHFIKTNPTVSSTNLTVVAVVGATTPPVQFKYEVVKVTTDGGGTKTIASLSTPVISGSFSVSATARNWVQVEIDDTASPDDITLWVNNSSFGPSNTGDDGWMAAHGGYMLEDTQTAAGKGASLGAWDFDDRVANDDIAGTGFTARPPSTWKGPPGP